MNSKILGVAILVFCGLVFALIYEPAANEAEHGDGALKEAAAEEEGLRDRSGSTQESRSLVSTISKERQVPTLENVPSAPRKSVEGFVFDSLGNPVHGARVYADSEISALPVEAEFFRTLLSDPVALEEFHIGESREDGSFAVLSARGKPPSRLGVHHRSLGSAFLESPLDGWSVRLGGTRLHGSVRSSDGLPLSKASVFIDGIQRVSDGMDASISLGHVRVDTDGSFETPYLPFDQYHLRAECEEFSASNVTTRLRETVREEQDIHFFLDPSRSLSGKLLLSDGKPAALLATLAPRLDPVELGSSPRSLAVFASIDSPLKKSFREFAAGSFPTRGQISVSEDRYRVDLARGGERFVSVWARGALLGMSSIDAEEVDIHLDLARLPPAPSTGQLRVRASCESGESVAGLRIEVCSEDFNPRSPSFFRRVETVPDTNSTAIFEGVPHGVYRTSVWAAGRVPAWRNVTLSPFAPEHDIVVPLQVATATLVGRIHDPSGAPVPKAMVVLLDEQGREVLPRTSGMTYSAEDGTFGFDSLFPGSFILRCTHRDYATQIATIRIGEDEPTDIGVLLTEGNQVSIIPTGSKTGGPFRAQVLDEDGTLIVDDVKEGRQHFGSSIKVRLRPGLYRARVISLDSEEGEVDFVAQPGERVFVSMFAKESL